MTVFQRPSTLAVKRPTSSLVGDGRVHLGAALLSPGEAELANPERLAAVRATGLPGAERSPALDRWTRLARELVEAPMALLTLVTDERQLLGSEAGLPPELAAATDLPLSHSICRHVVTGRRRLVVRDAREDLRLRGHPAVRELGVVAYAGQPVVTADGHVLGALCVLDVVPREWCAEELRLLEDLAAGLSAELRAAAALRELDVLKGEATRRALQDPPIAEQAGRLEHEVLRAALGEADVGPRAPDVAELVRRVALGLGVPREALDDVVLGARLRDVSRMAEPGDGDGPAEAARGGRILAASPALRRAADVVRAVHERWDGTGGPDGLAAGAIPRGARITAVCDAYAALAAEPGMTPEAAVAALRAEAGTRFDPAVVAALAAAIL